MFFIYLFLFYYWINAGWSSCVYTYTDHTGNRFIRGKSTFPAVKTFELKHPGVMTGGDHGAPIQWVVGKEGVNHTVNWFATDTNNRVWMFEHHRGHQPKYIRSMETPLIPFLADRAFRQPPDFSHLSHPVCLRDTDHLLYISDSGDIVLIDRFGKELARKKVNALRDARLVLNRDLSLVAFYTEAPNKGPYVNGILGDTIEGAAIVILRAEDLSSVREIRISDEHVIFEGLSPMWVDVDENGEDEIVATISDHESGASIFVFDIEGNVVARSEPVGQPSGWRHQLAAAKFGPDSHVEIVALHTPHLGKVIQFFVKDGDRLRLVGSRHGFTTHVHGSRNLDMAVAGDFDGNGYPEIVVPGESLNRIIGLRHSSRGFQQGYVREAWEFWLGKRLTSNLAAVRTSEDHLCLGIGFEDGSIRIFVPNDF